MNCTLQWKGTFVVLVYLSHVPSYDKRYSTAGRNLYVIRRLNWLLTVFVEVLHVAVLCGGSSKTKYLGTTVTRDNLIEEEMKERIAAANRASFAKQKIFQCKLTSKKTKMKLYKTLIRPVVVYGSECWVLTENIKQK